LAGKSCYAQVLDIAKAAAISQTAVGPSLEGEHIARLLTTAIQFDRVQAMIAKGIDEGCHVSAGPGKPDGAMRFVKPTIFADVRNDIWRRTQEIFGPVLSSSHSTRRKRSPTTRLLTVYAHLQD
jgi:aldehyde dehydrogenase (NAD+)